MRVKPNESFEDWSDRVIEFETAVAKQKLINGVDQDSVLESMAERVQNKILYYLIVEIRQQASSIPFDLEENKKRYQLEYLDKNKPKPDHVSNEI